MPEANAEEITDRTSTVYFVAYDESGGFLRYTNSGRPLLGDGDVCTFTSFMSEYKTEIFTDNYTDCTYTSLNPDILDVTQYQDKRDGYVMKATLIRKKTGIARIRIDVPENEEYKAYTLYCDIKVVKQDRQGVRFCKRIVDNGETVETIGSQYLRDGQTDSSSFSLTMDEDEPSIYLDQIRAEYYSSDENILSINRETGEITLHKTGDVLVTAVVPEDNYYNAATYYCRLSVTRKPGIIFSSYEGEITSQLSDGTYQLNIAPLPGQTLEYHSCDVSIAEVDAYGCVTFRKPGRVCIEVTSIGDSRYDSGPYRVFITITDASHAASVSGYNAGSVSAVRTVTAAKTAIKLHKPKLKCTKKYKRANKLTWSKVDSASGYQLYIKYPGNKKYQKALTKKATVKSVTHRGLKKGKYYYYKLRAYVRIGGKIYYGPFSRTVKVKVR